ncbi:MAG: rhodanese-like domain-containing protein [Gemmatimonadetes bacterium]|nr:rhodanese-like domain-containing protein [Gemmatimonadota bacterium]NIR80685.1 rhodanese-like domain-containing protein [Gemmatimonadota bacterium]NIT89476.1 rhodanese-like domain-containing protein [Gemmatimonadota bacterium]NIU33279.1 rhodanese-like domain-containing protein [Gemmatimonadota bacterium]NIV63614.1 rhodanese-like domain-containing protein [Gemmatimonadota bacterium]
MTIELERISRQELKEKIDRGEDFHLVEVLPEDSFQEGHLPGAVNIPGDQLRERAPDAFPHKDAEIVVYCANPSCEASPRAARLLTEMGYTNVKDYAGGKEHWKEGGLPLETGREAPQPV